LRDEQLTLRLLDQFPNLSLSLPLRAPSTQPKVFQRVQDQRIAARFTLSFHLVSPGL
jgi:hypothetical protein